MHHIFKFGWFLIILEFSYALYWIGTMFYVLGPGNASEALRTFHAFLIVHTVVIPLTIYLAIRARHHDPEKFLLFPFGLELFYDLYGLLSAVRYLDQSYPTTYNIEFAGIIWAFSMSCLVLLWYCILVMTGIKDVRKVKPRTFY
jgi:hypothetical protein